MNLSQNCSVIENGGSWTDTGLKFGVGDITTTYTLYVVAMSESYISVIVAGNINYRHSLHLSQNRYGGVFIIYIHNYYSH